MLSGQDGKVAEIEGIVVGDFQNTLNGFFVQEEDSDIDSNPLTSEGIFVFSSTPVNVGDKVRVKGTVDEYFNLTEITGVTSLVKLGSGNPLPTASTVNLPFPAPDFVERFEGMRVRLPQTLYVTQHSFLGRGGYFEVSSNGRLIQPTGATTPGASANLLQAANDLNRILIDDGRTNQNPDPIIYPNPALTASNPLRGDNTVQNVVGVLTESWSGWAGTDAYRVHPTAAVTMESANGRQTTPADVRGSLKIASFNVLNYFTTIDSGASICGPSGNQECRGADSSGEFTRQRDKILSALSRIDADITGLIELENNAAVSLQDLVNGLNSIAGAGTYSFINTGTIGSDAIKVGIVFQPGTVTPVGPFRVLDDSVDPTFNQVANRPSLAQTFEENATGEKFTVIVNHFKSKGSSCAAPPENDPDTGDGQGNCNLTRLNAAKALTNWIGSDPTVSGDPDVLIIGDLNAYAMEDPVEWIKSEGYTDLVRRFGGSASYTFNSEGQWGYLDHALANASLLPRVTGTIVWHINSDEPGVLDYNVEFKSAGQITSLYASDPFRSSDHDPVIVGLNPSGSPLPCTNPPVKLQRSGIMYRDTIQKVYDDAAADGGVIMILDSTVEGADYSGIEFNRDISVLLNGGFNCIYSDDTFGMSYIRGALKILNGTVTFKNIASTGN